MVGCKEGSGWSPGPGGSRGHGDVGEEMAEGASTRQRGGVMGTWVDISAWALIFKWQHTNTSQHVSSDLANCRDLETTMLKTSLHWYPSPSWLEEIQFQSLSLSAKKKHLPNYTENKKLATNNTLSLNLSNIGTFCFLFSLGGIFLSISIPGPPVQKCITSNTVELTSSKSCVAPRWLNL